MSAARHWLMKSEPDVFSIDDLALKGTTGWDGVRNYQARNFMREMRVGEAVLFYHSNAEPSGAAGTAVVVRAAYADPTQFNPNNDRFDPRATADKPVWFQVDVRFVSKFPRFISLEELRGINELSDMMLFRRSRLSVQPLTKAQWTAIARRGRRGSSPRD
ncbi:MAG: EVE domain-containing protein [Elusimicrobiota bacterium]